MASSLCDHDEVVRQARQAFKGVTPWETSKQFTVGAQVTMTIEDCVDFGNGVANDLTNALLPGGGASIEFGFLITQDDGVRLPTDGIRGAEGSVGSTPTFSNAKHCDFRIRPRLASREASDQLASSYRLQAIARIRLSGCLTRQHYVALDDVFVFTQASLSIPTVAIFFKEEAYGGPAMVVTPSDTRLGRGAMGNKHVDALSPSKAFDTKNEVIEDLKALVTSLKRISIFSTSATPHRDGHDIPIPTRSTVDVFEAAVTALATADGFVLDSTGSIGKLWDVVPKKGFLGLDTSFDTAISSAVLIGVPGLASVRLFDEEAGKGGHCDLTVPQGSLIASIPDFSDMRTSDTSLPYARGTWPPANNWNDKARSLTVVRES
jgi:hypothetical protein